MPIALLNKNMRKHIKNILITLPPFDCTPSIGELIRLLGYPDDQAILDYIYQNSIHDYDYFEIPKKNGGMRKITAPKKGSIIRALQVNLNTELQKHIILKKMHLLDHAFIQGKSIVSNAELHIKKRYVFNIDLKDFFDHINLGRIRGFFIKNKHFNLSENVATVIAKIATYENKLPQGAPSSPIISNLVGSILDFYLLNLAKKNKCHYSRYADDITFSTNTKEFPRSIANQDHKNEHIWHPGNKLVELVKKAGFEINSSKVSMQYARSSQRVTGLIVNKKINIPVNYYKKTRAMVDHLEKWNFYKLDDSKKDKEYGWDKLNPLNGRLNYIYHIKSKADLLEAQKFGENLTITDSNKSYVQLYRRFVFYKYFIKNPRPLIITEGKTDISHIKQALNRIGAGHPSLVAEGKIKIHFLNHKSLYSQLLGLGNNKQTSGVGVIRNFLDQCHLHYERFKRPLFENPVIIILDNDSGLTHFQGNNRKSKFDYLAGLEGRLYNNVYKNINLLPLMPYVSNREGKFNNQGYAIEQMYPADLVKGVKTAQEKKYFAESTIRFISEENFLNFRPLFKKMEEIIFNHYLVQNKKIYFCKHGDIEARGILLENGSFLMLGNSEISIEHDINSRYFKSQLSLIKEGAIIQLEGQFLLKHNYIFSSPSAAASLVIGRQVNGWVYWERNGFCLQDLEGR